MFEKLEQAEKKFTALNESLADPTVLGDIEKMNAALKEIKHMTPVVEKYREYKKLLVEMDDARTLLAEPGLDPDLAAMAEEELESAKKKSEEAAEALKVLLLPADPNDEKNVIIEIRAGAGGEEAGRGGGGGGGGGGGWGEWCGGV